MSSILLPLFIMHFCTYVIIGPTGNIERQVAAAFAPFDESLEVEPHKVYLEDVEIKRMAGHYGLQESDVPALIEKMQDWRGSEGGIDEVGLFSRTTANPEGLWDWYEIGGRWKGNFHGRNVIKAGMLLKSSDLQEHLPFSFVTPECEWHEVEKLVDAGDFKFTVVRKSPSRWLIELKEALARHPEHRVVCVDIHR